MTQATRKTKFDSIGVFCGSSFGARENYRVQAEQLGTLMAEQNLTLVYGGGRVGLMGALADAALAAGGRVIGVIPKLLYSKEIAHDGLTQLHVVESMAERKQLMIELSDAFVSLPGGIGTLDELTEVWTWTQLGVHQKPSGLLNVSGYFDHLLAFIDQSVVEQFLRAEHRALLLVDDNAKQLLARLHQQVEAVIQRSS